MTIFSNNRLHFFCDRMIDQANPIYGFRLYPGYGLYTFYWGRWYISLNIRDLREFKS